jgi:microcompartment protein CcmL/EutN
MGGKGVCLITGDVGDVTAAVEAGAKHAQDAGVYYGSSVIAAPHEALWEQI